MLSFYDLIETTSKRENVGVGSVNLQKYSIIQPTILLSDKSHLCGFAGCRFHGVCAKDSYEGRYRCECPKCNDFDNSSDGIVCGEIKTPTKYR